ncbi:MAG: hypothetical protein K6G38_06280 [Gammaproteobacteria bacterium]|nr:hypothetical protein [Gammaproteobacteria bacterium]
MKIGKKKSVKEAEVKEPEMVTVECAEGEEVEITEFPAQTTFNTEDMSIVEDGE